jgi:hypothetical protein
VRWSHAFVAAPVIAVLVVGAAVLYRLPLDEAIALAPVIVVTVGTTVALFVLWTRIVVDSLRTQRHPGRIVAAAGAAFALLVVISFFVDLPSMH